MGPESRQVARFAAEPPQDSEPYGRWRERLQTEFLAAAQGLDDVGQLGEITFYPDRTWHGRTFVPATAPTDTDLQVFGYVVFVAAQGPDEEPSDFGSWADYTDDTAEHNPQWQLDLCDEVIGRWRGDAGRVAAMTLVWGQALRDGGAVATAELADLVVDQCKLDGDRFTLIAPDDYAGDLLDVKLYSAGGEQLARESLYDDDV